MTINNALNRTKFARWWRKEAKLYKKLPIMFSDEKYFVVDAAANRQNTRVYALSREKADLKHRVFAKWKEPIRAMVWIGLTVNGPTRPYFVKIGDSIDGVHYIRKILPVAKKDGNELFKTNKWVIFLNAFLKK